MSLFTLGKVEEQASPQGVIPEGKHVGKIMATNVKKSAAGHEYVAFIIKTDVGQIFQGLNLNHPNAKESAHKSLSQILSYGYIEAPRTLETIMDVAQAIEGVPVHVTVKHAGKNDKGYMNYNVYYNALPSDVERKSAVASDLPF